MSYKYRNMTNVKAGDIVEHQGSTRSDVFGKAKQLCIVTKVNKDNDSIHTNINPDEWFYNGYFKLLVTKPGSEAKVGDSIILVKNYGGICKVGDINTVHEIIGETSNRFLIWNKVLGAHRHDYEFLVLCKEEEPPDTKYKVGDTIVFRLPYSDHLNTVEAIVYNTPSGKWQYQYTGGGDDNCTDVDKCSNHFLQEEPTKRTEFIGCKIRVTPDNRQAIKAKLIEYKLASESLEDLATNYYIHETYTKASMSSKESYFTNYRCKEIYWVDGDFSVEEPTFKTTTQKQGNNMESICNENITITMTAAEYAKHNKADKCKVKTDLEKKLPFAMVVYSNTGEYISIHYNTTRKGVKKRKDAFLQKPWNLGCTVTLHEAFGEFTTAIPVVEVK